jgi:methyl-accepting chemotaxis protein
VLNRLTIRARLAILGVGAVAMLTVLGAVAIISMQGMSSQSSQSTHDANAATALSHAYESWILDDDQSNMYAAVLALNDPSQHALAETTWGQAATAYAATAKQLANLKTLLSTPAEQALFAKIDTNLASYNSFSLKLRAYGKANKIHQAVHVMTVDNLKPSNALPLQFSALRNQLEKASAASSASLKSSASSATVILLIVALIALPFVIGLCVLITRSIAASIKRLLAATDRIAQGDLDAEDGDSKKGGDEIDRATHTLRENILGYLRPIADAATSVADGDLTAQVEPRSERDTLGIAVSGMLDSLRALIGELGKAGNQVAGASQGLAGASSETGRAVSEIATAIESVADGAGRQVQMVDGARNAAQQTAEAATLAQTVAGEGIAAAEQASSAMALVRDSSGEVSQAIESLAQKSEQIGGIVETITGIAGQTNLLALNAAIEAARAGEQGRGFAVVAEEVRKLAEESQQAASSIAELIAEIQSETGRTVEAVAESTQRSQDGVDVVEQAREAFGRIGEHIGDIAARVTQIAESSGEIASVAEQTSATSEQVSASTEETSAATEEIAASAQALAGTAETLQELVGRFTI